jgi:L-arginine dehydrogenase
MQMLDSQQVGHLLPRLDCLSAMRRLFGALARGDVVQPRQTLALLPGREQGGDFITYTAALAEPAVFGAKLSPYLPGAAGAKVTAWTLLMSSVDGMPLLLCDAMALTIERTAATTALAVDLLAPADGGKLAVIGTGPIGIAHIRQTRHLRQWSEISCWSPRAASRAAEIQAAAPGVIIAPSLDAAVRDARVVLLCTSSAAPVLDPRRLADCVLVTSITTNAPGAHEVPPDCLRDLDVYCDFAETTPQTAAEMRLAVEMGWSVESIAGDLPALVSGSAPRPRRAAYFRSVGLGSEDIAVAASLYELVRAESGR